MKNISIFFVGENINNIGSAPFGNNSDANGADLGRKISVFLNIPISEVYRFAFGKHGDGRMATPPEMLRATTEDQINEQEHQVKDDSAAKENDRHLFQDHVCI